MDFINIKQVKQYKNDWTSVMKQIKNIDEIGYYCNGSYYADIIGMEYHRGGVEYHYDLDDVSVKKYRKWIKSVMCEINNMLGVWM